MSNTTELVPEYYVNDEIDVRDVEEYEDDSIWEDTQSTPKKVKFNCLM